MGLLFTLDTEQLHSKNKQRQVHTHVSVCVYCISSAAGQTVSSSAQSESHSASPAKAPSPPPSSTNSAAASAAAVTSQPVSPRQKSLAADGSPAVGNHAWGPSRTVELVRQEGKSLGISIVGKDCFHPLSGHQYRG